ncbi:pyrimidine/purine nucleoside phosphorylase [Acinetobacter sp. ANC 7454]|uniref:pyrimidine/purine nucleoside phosphorylase n=1 Tax=Acinetobacter TaxID=469 RepID=UPI0005528994|nr:pyrimidine/purine nucleoside phosphorylase [Acinetobacter sp. HR7]
MSGQFDFVSILKKPRIHSNGCCISHCIQMPDGSQKTLGVFLPTEQPIVFETTLAERLEIISGECLVQIGDDAYYQRYVPGQSFYVPKHSQFRLLCNEIVDYVCHFE